MLDKEGSLSLQHREVFLITVVNAYGVLDRRQSLTIVFTRLLLNTTQGSRYVLWMEAEGHMEYSKGELKRVRQHLY